MICKVCGNPRGELRDGRRGVLCNSCFQTTPPKISYQEFTERYFHGEAIYYGIAKEFYDDYRTSNLDFEEYVRRTTEVI